MLLGRLDLFAARHFGVAHLGVSRDLAADADEVATQSQVVDDAGVVGDVGGRRRAVHQVGQISHAAQFLEGGVALKLFGEQNRLGQLPAAHGVLDGAEQPAMERLEEMSRLERVAQALISAVVIQKNAKQGLFSLYVRRGVKDVSRRRGRAQVEKGNDGHIYR